MKQLVTVVIATYNRAHLLDRVVPAYLQPEVTEAILVDDCSADSTKQVVTALMLRYPGRIRYVRTRENRKQAYAKNIGKSLCDTPYVFFGDDDSILMPGSIATLVGTSEEQGADIVGGAALYCRRDQSVEHLWENYQLQSTRNAQKDYVDLRRLRFCFKFRSSTPIELPVVHSGFLIKRDWYQRFSFDEMFQGNCYREETDFVLSCKCAGAKVLFDGRAGLVNLPPNVATGGARRYTRVKYEYYSVVNTLKFLQKHRAYFESTLRTWYLAPLAWFVWGRLTAAAKKLV